MKHTITFAVLLFASPTLLADDPTDRGLLVGKWQSEKGDGGETWRIATTADGLETAYSDRGDENVLRCNTQGRECQLKQSGDEIKISMWFNGPKLVQMETRGSDVVKRRFRVVDGGQALEVERIPIVPAGKPETTRFKRVDTLTSRASAP
jgi:hypothetical protein